MHNYRCGTHRRGDSKVSVYVYVSDILMVLKQIINRCFNSHRGDILRALVNESVSSDQLCLLATLKLKIRHRGSGSIWVTFFDAHCVDWCSHCAAAGDSLDTSNTISVCCFILTDFLDTLLSQMPLINWYSLLPFLHDCHKNKRDGFSSGGNGTSRNPSKVCFYCPHFITQIFGCFPEHSADFRQLFMISEDFYFINCSSFSLLNGPHKFPTIFVFTLHVLSKQQHEFVVVQTHNQRQTQKQQMCLVTNDTYLLSKWIKKSKYWYEKRHEI